jgi:hypothetical protein
LPLFHAISGPSRETKKRERLCGQPAAQLKNLAARLLRQRGVG